MTVLFGATLVGLGFVGAFASGLLGVGGAIVMIPLLLYGPPLLGVGELGIKAVAGVTMVQVFVAATSGMLAHRRFQAVNAELAGVGGLSMAVGSFAGALLSKYVHDKWLLLVFTLMVTAAALLLLVPIERGEALTPAEHIRFSRLRTTLVAGGVGVAAGLVGAGGAFLLVPLLVVVVGVPIRVTIGSSLAITALGATAGVAGKLVTGQIPLAPTLAVALFAIPGAQIGAALSHRLSASHLKLTLFLVILLTALREWWNVLFE